MVSLYDFPAENGRFFLTARRAKRCLFGMEDPKERRQYLKAELAKIYEDQKKKWNFDFQNEVPLPGRYQWVPVRSKSPEPSRTELAFGGRMEESGRMEEMKKEQDDERENRGDEEKSEEEQKCEMRQSRITEFLRAKKRSVPSSKADADQPTSKKPCSTSVHST